MILYDNNFLPIEKVVEVESEILHPSFSWYFNPASVPVGHEGAQWQTIRGESGDDVQFVHDLYINRQPYSPYYGKAIDVFERFCDKHDIKVRALLRAKINMTLSSGKEIVAPAHVDNTYDHKVFIYYVNNSDGMTLVYDQKFTGENPGKLTLLREFEPTAGSALVFDGLHYHSPSLPVKSRSRVIINICFI